MSFRCDECKKVQPSGSSPVTKIVSTREKFYPSLVYGSRSGKGVETVKEIQVCKSCSEKVVSV